MRQKHNGTTRAKKLCRQIEQYWFDRGYIVRCDVEESYVIVSDMINGYPKDFFR